MAAVIGALRAELSAAAAQFESDMGRAGKAVSKFSANFKRLGAQMTSVGKTLSTRLTAPLVAFGAVSVKAFADFEKGMANVSTLVDTAAESMARMGKQVLAIARRTPVAIADLTAALYDVRSAGIAAGDAMKVLEGSARLGVAGLGTTKEAVDLVTSSINAFNLVGEDQVGVYDLIFKTVKSGKTNISQLAQGFGAVAGTVAKAGIKLDEYLASVAALTTTGLPAAQAHTQIRAAIAGLTRETELSTKVFNHLGAKTFADLIKQSGGMVPAFQKIIAALGGNDAAIIKLVGSVEAYGAMVALTGGQNAAFTGTLDSMRNGANAVDEAFDKQNKTFAAVMQRTVNALQTIAIAVGTILAPALETLAGWLTAAADAFDSLSPEVQKAIVVIAALAAAIGPVLVVLGTLVTAIAAAAPVLAAIGGAIVALVSGPLGWFALAVGAIVYAFGGWSKVLAPIKMVYDAVKTWLMDKLAPVFDWLGRQVQRVKDFFGIASAAAAEAADEIELPPAKLDDQVVKPAEDAVAKVNVAFTGIKPIDFTGLGTSSKTAANDLQQLKDKIDPIGAAMRDYSAQMKLAETAGLDLALAHRVLRDEAFAALGGLDGVKGKLAELTPELRAAAEEARRLKFDQILADESKAMGERTKRLGQDMTMEFDPAAARDSRLKDIEDAWKAGTISVEVYEAAQKDAWKTFNDFGKSGADAFKRMDLALDRMGQTLTDLIFNTKDWKQSLLDLSKQLVQIFAIDPAMSGGKDWLSGLLQGGAGAAGGGAAGGAGSGSMWASLGMMFAGGFATGGVIPRGQWGIVGENGPEPVFAGNSDMTVVPNSGMGGGRVTQNFYVSTPDANSFRMSQRQLARSAKQRLAVA